MGSAPITYVETSKVQGEQSDAVTPGEGVRGTWFLPEVIPEVS